MAMTQAELEEQRRKAERIALSNSVIASYDYVKKDRYDKEGAVQDQVERTFQGDDTVPDAAPVKLKNVSLSREGDYDFATNSNAPSVPKGFQRRPTSIARGPSWFGGGAAYFDPPKTSEPLTARSEKERAAARRADKVDYQAPSRNTPRELSRARNSSLSTRDSELLALRPPTAEEKRLAQRDNYKRIDGGLVNTGEGDFGFMTGTREDGTAWNPNNEPLRMMNRTVGQKEADEEMRLRHVAQNRQMHANAAVVAGRYNREADQMALNNAANLARMKPTVTNLARHRTLATAMEQARQTRAEQQTAGQEARAAAVQQQFDNRMTVENLRVSRQNADSNSMRAKAAGKSKSESSTTVKMRNSMIEALSYKDKDPEGTKQRAYDVLQRFNARNPDYDRMSDVQKKTAVSAFTLGEQVSAAAQKATGGWFNPYGWFDGDPLRPESGAVNKDNLNTIKKAWGKNDNFVLNLKNYSEGAMTIGEFKEGLDELPGGRNAFKEVINNLHALGSMAKSQEIINRTAIGRDLQ